MAKRKRGKGRQSGAGETEKEPTTDGPEHPPGAEAESSRDDASAEEPGAEAEAKADPAADTKAKTDADAEAATDADAATEADAATDADADAATDAVADADRAPAPSVAAREPIGKPWGRPLARFDKKWTFFEARLITFVLVWQLLALVLWVVLNGLGLPVPHVSDVVDPKTNLVEKPAADMGMVFRAVFGALICALIGWFSTRGRALNVRRGAAMLGIAVGMLSVPLWRTVGMDYFDNVKRWLQEGSTLTLLGGLRGLGTRLTLWLALLGASLATAAGKHIHIDVIFRFLPAKLRLPAVVTNFAAAAVMCIAAAWGFVDHIAIESFGANADDLMLSQRPEPTNPDGDKTNPPAPMRRSKVGTILHHQGRHLFLTTKQIGLDLRSLPHVIAGEPYDGWMSAAEWNKWVRAAGFEDHYPPDQVSSLIVPEEGAAHTALVIAPDGDSVRGMLVHDLNLIFPFGMLVIALRFLLRILLALSGYIDLDPDAAHKEEILEIEHKTPENKATGGLS